MADEPQTPPEGEQKPAPEAKPAEAEKTVPYERFTEVNQQAKEAKAQLKEMQDKLQELEDKDKSELERERTTRERLQTELQDREQRLVRAERGAWVRDAASEAKFIDPADALGRIDLSEVESEADAKRAVKKVAESAKHLVQSEQKQPQIGQVLDKGQAVDPNNAAAVQAAKSKQENEEFLQQLRDASKAGWNSAPGLLEQQ